MFGRRPLIAGLPALTVPGLAVAQTSAPPAGQANQAAPGTAQPPAAPTAALTALSAIAEEAYLYGFPMLIGYKAMYAFNIDRDSGQFKAPFNQIANEARVFTAADTAISTPNSDTP